MLDLQVAWWMANVYSTKDEVQLVLPLLIQPYLYVTFFPVIHIGFSTPLEP